MTRLPFRLGILFLGLFFLLAGCKNKRADMLLVNGVVHTMDSQGTVAQALAVKDGKILSTGLTDELQFAYQADTIIDLRGGHVFPGLIDAHCHFYGYAMNQDRVNLVGTTSWQEVVDLVTSVTRDFKAEWIQGRGWDHTHWEKQQFPDKKLLDERFPDRPVYLKRVDGHAAIANSRALELAGITEKTKVQGGQIIKKGGRLTGLLLDNAMDLVEKAIPKSTDADITDALMRAEKKLFATGLTTVDDAGLDLHIIQLIDSLQRLGKLRIRVYAMANPTEENFAYFEKKGRYDTGLLHVCAFKVYADGALGSRGACLLRPYKDDPGNQGFIYSDPSAFREAAARIHKMGFQMATHCIGDSANRMILHIYGEILKGKNDSRWRIEHCQVVDTNDFGLFKQYSVWPSVQPTHAISDSRWAEDRVGKERMKGAYAYKTLFAQNQRICFGSDFPVEDINPMLGYHAAVARVDLEGKPYGGFYKQEAVGRDTALRAMTIWAAEANFEEKVKGSLEPGKFADFLILDQDLATMDEEQIPYARIRSTIVGGKIVFSGQTD
jgi:predicted amidohydrolase YtcJ